MALEVGIGGDERGDAHGIGNDVGAIAAVTQHDAEGAPVDRNGRQELEPHAAVAGAAGSQRAGHQHGLGTGGHIVRVVELNA